MDRARIVITGVGLTAPNGDSLEDYRKNLLAGKSGVVNFETRYIGTVPAGVCNFDPYRYQSKKLARRGTRAGAISIYSANEAIIDSGLKLDSHRKDKIGVFVGITEHGTVETENEVYNISQYGNDVKFWTHHHNPRTVANNPAGEVTINLGITGPHLCLGGACAAGNIGIIYGAQMLLLGEVDIAIAGGVSESIRSFGVFASFASQNALAKAQDPAKACRPFDLDRNGVVVSEGGALFTLERLDDALKRNVRIYAEIVGWAYNSDATDFVLPNPERQRECMEKALTMASISADDIDIINTHGTGTKQGDEFESEAIFSIFSGNKHISINNTKSMIGHTMGAAGALELAGNLGSFTDKKVHPTINLDNIDPECKINGIVSGCYKELDKVDFILNNSFGMLGINSALIVRRFEGF